MSGGYGGRLPPDPLPLLIRHVVEFSNGLLGWRLINSLPSLFQNSNLLDLLGSV